MQGALFRILHSASGFQPSPVPHVDTPGSPLPVHAVVDLMRGAPFFWCLAGGLAIERVVGRSYRAHDDIDL